MWEGRASGEEIEPQRQLEEVNETTLKFPLLYLCDSGENKKWNRAGWCYGPRSYA